MLTERATFPLMSHPNCDWRQGIEGTGGTLWAVLKLVEFV
jgi:hypothetical protein